MFVVAKEDPYKAFGVAKQVGEKDGVVTLEYFDLPGAEQFTIKLDSELVRETTISRQTRVYYFNEHLATWQYGFLVHDKGDFQIVQFSDGKSRELPTEDVFVRWARPVQNPEYLLANTVCDPSDLCSARRSFYDSQIQQRAASSGMSALLSCAIQLEPHQIEVVRRVLQDPVQRYLLADEVGLGKTIEAGVLIRQCILDANEECQILVLVPKGLIGQWRSELKVKFSLAHCMNTVDRILHVLTFEGDDDEEIRKLLPSTTMLVVDEAHHLTQITKKGRNRLFEDLVAHAPGIERLLLLSATPALHNERAFLEMLHLLDPIAYQLDQEDLFRRKIARRQALAEIVAGLIPSNVFFLDNTIRMLEPWFDEDPLLAQYARELTEILDTHPGEDDPKLIRGINQLHAHLSEVYRLHRRILRHRRSDLQGIAPGRDGVEVFHYQSSARELLAETIEDWRHTEASRLDIAPSVETSDRRQQSLWAALKRGAEYAISGPGAVGMFAINEGLVGDTQRFRAISRHLTKTEHFEDRSRALIKAIRSHLHDDIQCIVFCSDPWTADELTDRLTETLEASVYRIDQSMAGLSMDRVRTLGRILICDQKAEEGLNLQGGKKLVIHYDLPFNPNRVEQRLGRADRYGATEKLKSLVLICDDDPFEYRWLEFLRDCLRVFDRSVASLQYLIENFCDELVPALFDEGPHAIAALIDRSSGPEGEVETELIALERQDKLDALGAPPPDDQGQLAKIDADWKLLAACSTNWLEHGLQLARTDLSALQTHISRSPFGGDLDGAKAFYFSYRDDPPKTLMPRTEFFQNCREAVWIDWNRAGNRAGKSTIKTIDYTYSRDLVTSARENQLSLNLLRLGDPLYDGVAKIAGGGSYGRACAVLRYQPIPIDVQEIDLLLRFDFVVEADTDRITERVGKTFGSDELANSAMRRRGDMALQPTFRSVWLDRNLTPLNSDRIDQLLGVDVGPIGTEGYEEEDIGANQWRSLRAEGVPELGFWSEFCSNARASAEAVLKNDTDLQDALRDAARFEGRVSAGRIGQLRARVLAGGDSSLRAELEFEEKIATSLQSAIMNPGYRLDGVGAYFIVNDRPLFDRILKGNS